MVIILRKGFGYVKELISLFKVKVMEKECSSKNGYLIIESIAHCTFVP